MPDSVQFPGPLQTVLGQFVVWSIIHADLRPHLDLIGTIRTTADQCDNIYPWCTIHHLYHHTQNGMISMKNIHIGYHNALFSIEELNLQEGKVYALLGPNGKGKTTFLKTLSGLIPPIKGGLEVNGKLIRDLSREEMARMSAFVTPRFEGVDHLSVFNYILLGRTPYLRLTGKPSHNDLLVVEKIIKETGMEKLRAKNTDKISDGERQLASICRALAQETPVILLDEPTAFLDYTNKLKVIRLLKEIAHKQKKCIILSSHDVELCLEEKLTILALTNDNQLKQLDSVSKEALINLCFQDQPGN